MKEHTYVKGILMALTAGILWGMTGPMGQFLFDEKAMVPEWLVSYRMIASGILTLIWIYARKKNEVFEIWRCKKDARKIILYGIFGMMPVQYSFFAAVAASNGGTATVLQYTNPVMMIIYYAVFRKIKPTKRESLAVGLALLGIFLMATNGNINSLVMTPLGLFLGLLCAFFTCLYSMLPADLLRKYDAAVVCGWGMLVGGIVLFLWKQPWTIDVQLDMTVWGLFWLLVVGGTIIPFIASLSALPIIGPVYTNVLSTIEPLVASFLTFFLLGTTFGKMEIVGFGMIIATILILATQKEKEDN